MTQGLGTAHPPLLLVFFFPLGPPTRVDRDSYTVTCQHLRLKQESRRNDGGAPHNMEDGELESDLKRQQLEAKVKELEKRHMETGAGDVKLQQGIACKELKALNMDVEEHALLRTKQMYNVGGNNVGGTALGP
ncbi:hypothetical protein NDU88_003650 [Pleurodeles waltl]|uniref:Uncharacterized protein n=1 Tax=Pleurodeles waltl TaxID=8319 RepID=A0AAV7PCP2_PLEWA|nr:hypothetical protein NDU88_003650 [Pleurodeles waltl]